MPHVYIAGPLFNTHERWYTWSVSPRRWRELATPPSCPTATPD